jgi:hypothetical protein
MQFTAAQIAQIINGKVEGNADVAVHTFGKIEEAKAGELSFLANPKYEEYLYKTEASIVIINEQQELKQAVKSTLIRVQDAYMAFAGLLDAYQQMKSAQLTGIQEPSYIHSTASVGENTFIGAFAYLGENVKIGNGSKIYPGAYLGNNVTIGENTVIHPGVKIYHECVIGNHVTIHGGTIIGGDGFGFAPLPDGTLLVMQPSAKPFDFNTSSAFTIAGRMSPDRQAITEAPSSSCPNARASAANSASNSAALHSARSNFAQALSLGFRAFTLRTKSLGRPRFFSMRLNASKGEVVMTPPKSKITVLNVMFFLRVRI